MVTATKVTATVTVNQKTRHSPSLESAYFKGFFLDFICLNSSLLGLRRNGFLFHSVIFRMASYASILEFHIGPSR